MNTKLKAFSVCATATLLLGLSSCQKDPGNLPEPMLVVERASVCAQVAERGGDTKADFDGSTLDWTEGDKVVMVSNGNVNGTLTCTNAASGIFEGDVSQFTPAAVKFYFLGNREVGNVNATFDLSSQRGSEERLVDYLFLAPAGEVELEKTSDDGDPNITYALKEGETVSFNPVPLIPFLEVRLDKDGSPASQTGVKVSSVIISGLKNLLTIDLISGDVSASYVSGVETTTIAPARVADYAKRYYLAVIPQEASSVSFEIHYSGGSVDQEVWSGINWGSISAGSSYYTDWSKQSGLDIGSLSSKIGYDGFDITTGSDGSTKKGGYGGSNPDGTSDNPTGNKRGYGGSNNF